MANLIQLSNDLEYVPKEQLIQMSQNPDNNYPSYLVLAEIQRRTMNEKAYAAQQPKPETTVSQELVQEFAGSQGLGAMAQSSGSNAFPPSDMGNMAPPSGLGGMPSPEMPMQMMAGGGLTGYAEGGRTGYQVGGFTPTAENPYPTGSELVSDTLTSNDNKTIPIESLSEEQRYEILEKSEGMSTADKLVLGLNTAALGLLITPAPGARIASGATKLLGLGIRGGQGLKKMYDSARSARLLRAGQRESARLGGVPRTTPYNPEIIRETGRQALRRELPVKIASSAILGGSAVSAVSNLFDNDNIEENIIPNPTTINTTDTTAKEVVSDDVETGRRGLANFLPNADPSMLIGLGGAIMSSKNVGELGENISNVYTGIQKRRDTKELAGLQGRLMEAQISKYEADISNMPVKQLEFALKQLDAQITAGSFSSDEERKQAEIRYNQLLNSYLTKTGFSSLDASDERAAILKETGLG